LLSAFEPTTVRFKVHTDVIEGERSRTTSLLRSIASGRINDLARKIEIIPAAKPRHLRSPDLTEERSPFFFFTDRMHRNPGYSRLRAPVKCK